MQERKENQIKFDKNSHMKNLIICFLFVLPICKSLIAQAPPITSGLVLRLDAAVATSFHNNGANASVWDDLSGSGNHVTSLLTGSALTGAINPTWVGGTNPYLNFSGSSIMSRSSSVLNGTVGSVFIVSSDVNKGADYAMFAVGDDGGSGNYTYNEFCIVNGNTCTHTAPSNWIWRQAQCIVPTLSSKTIISSIWNNGGVTSTALDHFINGVKSTNTFTTTGSPTGLTASANRSVFIGSRIYNGFHQPLSGRIYEVLVYNRALTAAEITSVNNFLKTKYAINYNTCNTSINAISEAGQDAKDLFQISAIPGSNQATIDFSASQVIQGASIRITDLMGKEIDQVEIESATEEGQIKVDLKDYNNQVVLVSILHRGLMLESKKFVMINN
mgnify:CR=1 FL=1